jgi:antitoxin component YwqK of YwqJK toxin-antitoxin module
MIRKIIITIIFTSFVFSQMTEMEQRKLTENLRDGPFKEYYDNGNIQMEFVIKNGQFHGPSIYYNEEGGILISEYYQYGKRHGLSLEYYSEGHSAGNQIMWSTTYEYGILNGPMTWFTDDGKILEQKNFKNGKLNGPYVSYMTGWGETIDSQGIYKDGKKDGTWTEYFESGKVQLVENYKDKKLHGNQTYYYENLNIVSSNTNYKNGKKDGLYRWYSIKGNLVYEGNYVGGLREGVHKSYNISTGELETENTYSFDIQIKSKKY